MRWLMIGVVTAIAVTASTPTSWAGTVETTAKTDTNSVTVSVRREGHEGPTARPRRRSSSQRCFYYQGPLVYQLANSLGIEIPPPGQQGRWFTVACKRPDSPDYTYRLRYIPLRSLQATQAIDLAEEARRQLQLPEPEIRTSPPAGTDSVVGVPVYLWLPPEAWQAEEATAEIPGVVVTVRAVPDRTIWDMGNGDQVVCLGPGEAWDPSLPEDAQPATCRYSYRATSAGQPGERFTVTATVYWKASWSVAGAPGGGDLGEIARSSSTTTRVAQIQTVNIY
jgi:hypothetical protein